MTDKIDDIIEAILTDSFTRLSAASINALHGARSNHPWGAGKDAKQRAREAFAAVAGRDVNAKFRHALSKLCDIEYG